MIIKNPNFKNEAEFHASLKARGKGAKDYTNTHTEVEYLGNGKFAASIGVGHRVFFDKADGNKPKKHKLTDERPAKGYVLIQLAKCCVEVYPYYTKYFDPTHETVRLYEERWVVQRLFKAPNTWRDVDAYNPVMEFKDGDSWVSVTITYDTDYGKLLVRYSQGDGNNLAHHVLFVNESGTTQTFRVLQRWAGIVGGKCNGKNIPLSIDTPEEASHLAFHSADKPQKRFNITNNLHGQLYETVYEKTGRIIEQTYWDEELGKEVTIQVEGTRPVEKRKTEKCLKLPVRVETHASGMKADFIFERWTLAPTEGLTIGSPYALSFDGQDDYVDAGDLSAAESKIFTYELWFKGTNNKANQYIIAEGNSANNTPYVGLLTSPSTADGKVRTFFRTNTGATGATISSLNSLTDGEWHYLAFVSDGANYRLFVDGQQIGEKAVPAGTLTLDRATIGALRRIALGSYVNAILDEGRISDIARPPEEILTNWNDGNGKKLEVDANTIALWHMDEGEGGIIHDESPNGNDGTIYGASWTDGFPFGEDCPDSATLDDPTEDGVIQRDAYIPTDYARDKTGEGLEDIEWILEQVNGYRPYVEWDISSIPDGATITDTVFKYHCAWHGDHDAFIREMLGCQPSVQPDNNAGNQAIYDEIGEGTIYADPAGFPVEGTNQQVDLGATADSDLQSQLAADWFAIGWQGETGWSASRIYSEEYALANPKPTLYVEYEAVVAGWQGKISGVTNPAKIMGVDIANIAKVKGVTSA